MLPHCWVDFRNPKRIALFIATALLLAVFWSSLPDELRGELISRRAGGRLAGLMFIAWLGGWFIVLFVRGEDLCVSTPADVQGIIRVAGFGMILIALGIAAFLACGFFV